MFGHGQDAALSSWERARLNVISLWLRKGREIFFGLTDGALAFQKEFLLPEANYS